jgi:hypothetical protein
MQARNPKPDQGRSLGPAPFGIGPIARVSPASRSMPAGPAVGGSAPAATGARPGFGLPNLRRNICPHFYMTGARGAIPIQAPHLLKGLMRQESTISRCQVRGGVHLDPGFVNDVCLTGRFNQCVFYEDELTRE